MKHSGSTRTERGRWRVVVAEDNDDHALLIEKALEKASEIPVEIRRARNGTEAVDLVEESHPDLLLLDLKMPGRSGHEVLEHLKGNVDLRRIPVAVLTSSDRDEDIARSYGLGGNHFITKPENPGELERSLRTLLENLSELSSVRRGRGEMESTAVSAMDPVSLILRKTVTWGLVVLIVVGLAVYAWVSGALQ